VTSAQGQGRLTQPDSASRERRRFVSQNAIAAAGTLSAGVLGLLLQAFVSHHFHPLEYGQVFAVFSFFTVLTQPAAGFSRLVAWSTSRELASGDGTDLESSALLRLTNRRVLIFGTLLALAFVISAPFLGDYLHVPATYVIVGAVGVPFMFSAAPLQASLQGEQRWVSWSAISIGIALSRVVFVAVFVRFFGLDGVLLGITVAAIVIYLGCLVMVWPRLRRGRQPSGWRPVWRFLVVSIASTVTVSILMGSDVVLVEHFYGGAKGGQFSAVTVTSRALFFAMGSVSSVLFPQVAARHARAKRTRSVVFASLGLALIGGVLGLLVFSLGSHVILRAFSGKAYEAGSGYIGWYALGMPLLAAVVMLSNTQQSLADLRLLWVLIPGALLKPLLIVLFHQSLLVVSLMSDISIAAVVLALVVLYLASERGLQPVAVMHPPPQVADLGSVSAVLDADPEQVAQHRALQDLAEIMAELDALAEAELIASETAGMVL
jgi:O-antigen/teichoic acid export membrane protein